MTLNPKLIISQYYDSLVNQIDIHTEELINKTPETHEISSDLLKPGKEAYHEMSPDFFVKPDYFAPTFEVDSYSDPYTDKYTHSSTADEHCDQTFNKPASSIKLRAHFESIRREMIDELRRAERQAMDDCETLIRKDLNWKASKSRCVVDEIKEQLFERKFYLIVRVDRVNLEAFEAVANRSWFKIYLFELDFYLDGESQEFLM